MDKQVDGLQPTINDLHEAYKIEVTRLGEYYTNKLFKTTLDKFKDYGKLAKHLNKQPVNKTIFRSAITGEGIIDIRNPDEFIYIRKMVSDLAGMCCSFDQWKVFLGEDIESISNAYLKYNLSQIDSNNQFIINENYLKLDLSDSSRCTHLLKLFGLLPVNTHNYNLLSIGSAAGNRERLAMNTIPHIETCLNADKSQLLTKFSYNKKPFKNITLIDSDPFWSQLYSKLNASNIDVTAYNQDMYTSLDSLAHSIKHDKAEKVNLISIWKLEHTAFDDIPLLFSKLKPVISEKTHLIITIGAGNTDDEFASRQNALLEIKDFLSNSSASPVIFKLHNDSRLSPIFGHFRFASHELLHCKLNTNLL